MNDVQEGVRSYTGPACGGGGRKEEEKLRGHPQPSTYRA